MRSKQFPAVDVVKCEDKEARLVSFIKDKVSAEATTGGSQRLSLIARSCESPVAAAVLSALKEHGRGAGLRMIVTGLEADLEDEAAPALARLADEVRVARDPRLIDAHEQLVMGPSTSWIGDSMRRDPRKRDAFECFAPDCAETARLAMISFERLWQISEPVAIPRAVAEGDGLEVGDVAAAEPAVRPAVRPH